MAGPETSDVSVKRVAILVDTSTTWGRDVITGIHQYSSKKAGWELFVEPRGVDQHRWLPAAWKGDGVIARVGFHELAKTLKSLKIPVVNVSGITLPKCSFPRVVSDQIAAANLAAEHLLARGFRNFGYFSLLGLEYVADHQQAFIDALRLADQRCEVFSVSQHLADEANWKVDMKRLKEWLKNAPKPLAIFTWNSSSARDLIYACKQSKIAVPEEVAVLCGADDDLLCVVTPVEISAVKIDAIQTGYRAAEKLDVMMQNPAAAPPGDVLIRPRGVVERRSTETLAINDPSMVRALRFIRENPARSMSVNDVAAQAGLCRRALEIRFQNLLGRSPASEIRRVRIDHAIQLLQRTNLSVIAVAEQSGFSSSEYMASVFRKQLSATPIEYRRQTSAD